MDQKTVSIVSYITLIGWIIALVSHGNSPDKGSLGTFHLRQSFGIMVTYIALYIGIMVLTFIMPFFGLLIFVIGIGMLVLWIMGLISAVNAEEKPVPLLGEFYQKTFTFIN